MKTFKHYLQESEYLAENPTIGDSFDIEIAREEIVLESYVVDIVEDGIVIQADETMMRILTHVGYLTEDSNMPTAQDSTSPINGKKDARRYNFETSPDNDLEEQQTGTAPKTTRPDPFDELDAAITASKSGQAQDLSGDIESFRSRVQSGQAGKGAKWSEMSDIEREELRRQGFGPKPPVKEDYKNPVASAVLHRIMMQHPGVLATHGPERVMQAVDELADYVGDVDEIGSSDVSAWTRDVIRMLAELPDEPLDEADASTDPFSMDDTEAWANKIRKTVPKTRIDTTNWTDEQRYTHDKKTGKFQGPGGFDEWKANRAARTQPQPVTPPTTAPTNEAKYRGREVPLGKKMAGDVKKSKVYVRKPNGNIVKVEFGDPNMRIKKSNPARRRSFRARHNCDNPGPRWKARYWSCRSW